MRTLRRHHQPDGTAYGEPAELSLRCLAAAEEAGIAITLLPTLYNHGGFGGQKPASGQRRFINNISETWSMHSIIGT